LHVQDAPLLFIRVLVEYLLGLRAPVSTVFKQKPVFVNKLSTTLVIFCMLDRVHCGPSQPPALGKFGEEVVVVSTSEVRVAEKLLADEVVDTADGPVKGRAGDFVILTESAERYPIRSSVFLGAYQVLGRVGTRYIARRLLHARRAWPIDSAAAELNYGSGRGTVTGERGGWIYRSDDDDYGLVNNKQNTATHIVAGTARALDRASWEVLFRRTSLALIVLPPLMTLLALAALVASTTYGRQDLASALLASEGALLIAGVGVAWWVKHRRWSTRAAIRFADRIARDFQVAAEMLGEPRSELFPGMVLWRAAQSEAPVAGPFQPQQLRELKDKVAHACDRSKREVERHRTAEAIASLASAAAAIVVIGCIAALMFVHDERIELAAIWLPSVIGALHALNWNRQVAARKDATREYLSELRCVRAQLFALAGEDHGASRDERHLDQLVATLRTLCRISAEQAQRELRFVLGEDPNLPI
jgi:hypothetical protein